MTAWLTAKGGRVVLHYLPCRAPEENPIERVFWRLHEDVTRNHRCATMKELLHEVQGWCDERYFYPSVADHTIAA